MYSGGINSWCAAKRVLEQHGKAGVVLVFADTGCEDADLYRFLDETADRFGVRLVRMQQLLRDIWSVYSEFGEIDGEHCARELKRDPCQQFLERNFDPDAVTVYVGLDWTESHRLEQLRKNYPKWKYEAPLTEAPYLSKVEMLDMLRADGIRIPKLYELGFPHNNCGGFCPKSGLTHFRNLFEKNPEKYRDCEQKEKLLGMSFLNVRGKAITLESYRERHLEPKSFVDEFDWGGCGCFT